MAPVERPDSGLPLFRQKEPKLPASNTRRERVAFDAVIFALCGYPVASVAADLMNPHWSPVERMVSYYVHARAGWLVTVALLSLSVASAVLLRLAVHRTQGGRAGLWLLGTWTIAVLLGGVFPVDPYGQWDRPPTPAGVVHGLAGLIAFVSLPTAAVALTRTWRRDPRWPPVTRPLIVATVVTTTTFLAWLVAFIDVQSGPSLSAGRWESLVGLAERLMLWSYVAWLAIAAVGLRRTTRN